MKPEDEENIFRGVLFSWFLAVVMLCMLFGGAFQRMLHDTCLSMSNAAAIFSSSFEIAFASEENREKEVEKMSKKESQKEIEETEEVAVEEKRKKKRAEAPQLQQAAM